MGVWIHGLIVRSNFHVRGLSYQDSPANHDDSEPNASAFFMGDDLSYHDLFMKHDKWRRRDSNS